MNWEASTEEFRVKSACKGYRLALYFPSYTCLSVNDEVVHGIGVENRILKDGDVISVDVCIREDGMIGDNVERSQLVWFPLKWTNS